MSKRYAFSGYETMASGYTNGLYLPNKPLDEWNIDECKRALCRHANGDVTRCLDCENKCRYGRRIDVLLAPTNAENSVENPDESRKVMGYVKSAQARKRNSEIKYMKIIASGDAKAYLESHGMEIRNNMSRIRKQYANVTQEEARKRLAELGEEVLEEQKCKESPAEQKSNENQEKIKYEREEHEIHDKTEKTESNETIKHDGVKLEIHTVIGNYFKYTRSGGGTLEINPNPLCIASKSEVDAICNEIKTAFEMMA